MTRLLEDSWSEGSSSGLGVDLRKICNEWNRFDDFAERIAPSLTANSEYEDRRFFDKTVRSTLETCDLTRDLEALARSASVSDGGSGQALRAFRYHAGEVTIGLSPLLNRHFARRSTRTLWINVLSGCDFITPHSHKNLPKCNLCGKNEIDILHLLLDCPKMDQNMSWLHKIVRKLTAAVRWGRKIEDRIVAEENCQLPQIRPKILQIPRFTGVSSRGIYFR